MEIRLGSLVRGAQEAEGAAIIIDVFRAFTTAASAFRRGARRIALIDGVELAANLRQPGVGAFCVGATGRRANRAIRR